MKRELSQMAKLSVYRSIFVPTLTYGHEGWVMTDRTRSRIKVAEMRFLCRDTGLQTGPTGKRPPGRPRLSWGKYISAMMSKERLGIPESELASAARERKGWS